MGELLFIVAIILCGLAVPVGIVWGFIADFYKCNWRTAISKLSIRFRSMAIGIDCFGNVTCPELLQWLFTKGSNPYKFGNHLETVSFVLGMNLDSGNLNWFGLFVTNKILIKLKDPLNT